MLTPYRTAGSTADSGDRRNTRSQDRSGEGKNLGWGHPPEDLRGRLLSRSSTAARSAGVACEVAALREVLPQEAVRVLVRGALSRSPRVGKEHALGEEGRDLVVARHLRSSPRPPVNVSPFIRGEARGSARDRHAPPGRVHTPSSWRGAVNSKRDRAPVGATILELSRPGADLRGPVGETVIWPIHRKALAGPHSTRAATDDRGQ